MSTSSSHPYDPLNSKSAGLASNHSNLERDPLSTTSDTLSNGSLEVPTRATPAEPPQLVVTNPTKTVPMPTARPTPVPEYKPSYEEHTFPQLPRREK